MGERSGMTGERTIVANATCLGCGCACDDIDVVVEGGRIAEPRHACELGVRWFGDGQVPARATLVGRDVPAQRAIAGAAQLLSDAVRPLVYLAPGISCEAQREAVAIADAVHATLDTVTSSTVLPLTLATQERGLASATLGELRNRADVVVFWAVDPAWRYPRFTSRYAPEPPGLHVPDGRRSRTVIAIDIEGVAASVDADRRIAIRNGDELATLTALRALVATRAEDGSNYSSSSGAAWDHARELAPALLEGRYVGLVFDAEPDADPPAHRSAQRFGALAALAQALNERTRCAAIGLRAGGNRSGAEAVLTWQTGYPAAVDFARGHPRYRPHDGSAPAHLGHGDADGALVLGTVSLMPPAITRALANVRCAVIGPAASDSPLASAEVVIDTGVAGIHSGGTALRMDDVPLPLRPSLSGPPDAADVARAIAERLSGRPIRESSDATPLVRRGGKASTV